MDYTILFEKKSSEKMKKLIPDFTKKEFWANLFVGLTTFLILWWLGIIQCAFEIGEKEGRWFVNLIL